MTKVIAPAIGIVLFLGSCREARPAHPAGNTTNINIISSDTVVLSNWISFYDNGTDFTYSSTITWSAITQDIRDNGLVMAYLKNDSSSWITLPCSHAADGCSDAFNLEVNTGIVNITYDGYDLTGSPGTAALNGCITVHLVALPASARTANPDIDWNNHEQVSAFINAQQ